MDNNMDYELARKENNSRLRKIMLALADMHEPKLRSKLNEFFDDIESYQRNKTKPC